MMLDRTIFLYRHPDGSLWNLGRNGHGKHRGHGPSVVYNGEALAVMNLVLKHTQNDGERSADHTYTG